MTVARKKAAHAQRGKAELNPHDALVLLAATQRIDKLVTRVRRLGKTEGPSQGQGGARLCMPGTLRGDQARVFYSGGRCVLAGEEKELMARRR